MNKSFHDKRLASKAVPVSYIFTHSFHIVDLAAFGIGVHHAGLSMDDRRATEDLFIEKILRVVVATSVRSLAMFVCYSKLPM